MNASTPIAAHRWDREPHEHYVEPEWCSARLFEVEGFEGRVVDPCAGFGNIVRSARAAGLQVEGYDLVQRAPDIRGGMNFFDPYCWTPGIWPAENIVSNPPYASVLSLTKHQPSWVNERGRAEEEFLRIALTRARSKVALFLPASWLNASDRGAWLETLPLYRVYFLGPRPSCPPGHVIAAGHKPGNGKQDFAWLVFLKGFAGAPTLHWIRRDG